MASPSAATAPVLCPACQAPVTPGNRFCGQCGASVGAAPPPAAAMAAPAAMGVAPTAMDAPPAASFAAPAAPSVAPPGTAPAAAPGGMPGATPVDIRTRVDQDRGFLKRLELLIPGFRGYRQGEDIRAADALLRLQIADKTHRALVALQECRSALAQANQFQTMTDLANGISDLMVLEGEIRHAEQGYSGIAATVRVRPDTLDRLYEYDFGFAQAGDQLAATVAPLRDTITSDPSQIPAAVAQLRAQIRQLDAAFKARMRAVEGIQV